ncbi:MAG: phosphate ABC transporter permease PstA [Candidatus Cloacimonetes bacterium]|nr:phosphate ABC transporter permease PstA [Candidatus Cloacimonadota bacterium]HOA29267.1 phosphate ABC transporter permease PstA [Candidatus Cloacimonadota bacterium]HOH60320.1 phosphate ABC transporter permease PstA [Candidatus Cloacimonadota bacterium]
MNRDIYAKIGISALYAAVVCSVGFLILFITSIFLKGAGVLSIEFIFSGPRSAMTEGGIWPALVGTFWLSLLAVMVSVPIGILCAVWLFAYAKSSRLVSIIKICVNTLAGVPSIIYGLFGMAIFVNMAGLDVSLISGALTLAILSLPIVINASYEALSSVSQDYMEASFALGASKRQSILRVLIPTALPGILTSVILVTGRVAGETAPIMFTAATFFNRQLPKSLSDEVMALPYHIFALMTEGTHAAKQGPIAYGSALILLLLVLSISSVSLIFRYRLRKKRQW